MCNSLGTRQSSESDPQTVQWAWTVWSFGRSVGVAIEVCNSLGTRQSSDGHGQSDHLADWWVWPSRCAIVYGSYSPLTAQWANNNSLETRQSGPPGSYTSQ